MFQNANISLFPLVYLLHVRAGVKVFNCNNVGITPEITWTGVFWEQLLPAALLRDCIVPLVLFPKHEWIIAVGALRTLEPSQPTNEIATTPLPNSNLDCKNDLISFWFRIFSCWRFPASVSGGEKKIYIYHAKYWLQWSCHVQRVILKSEIFNFSTFKYFFFVNKVFKTQAQTWLVEKKKNRKLQLCELNIFSRLLKAFQACNAAPVKPKNKKCVDLQIKGSFTLNLEGPL